jgi:hypothetical protein
MLPKVGVDMSDSQSNISKASSVYSLTQHHDKKREKHLKKLKSPGSMAVNKSDYPASAILSNPKSAAHQILPI